MTQRPDSHTRPPRHLPADVLAWRSDVLRHAGCEPGLAWQLAADGGMDLHDLLNLIDRGCPPELAARILAPLDRPQPGVLGALIEAPSHLKRSDPDSPG